METKLEKAKELNDFLAKALKDIRSGKLNHDTAKSITLIADKINKNNVNTLNYKRQTNHSRPLEFFE